MRDVRQIGCRECGAVGHERLRTSGVTTGWRTASAAFQPCSIFVIHLFNRRISGSRSNRLDFERGELGWSE